LRESINELNDSHLKGKFVVANVELSFTLFEKVEVEYRNRDNIGGNIGRYVSCLCFNDE
jgi:hypothetical protein